MKASKMVACLSVSAVLFVPVRLRASGDGTGYTALCGGGLAGGGICRGLPGRLSGRARFRRHPLRPDHFAAGCRGGVTSDLEQPVSWTFECEEAGFYNVYVEYIPLPGTGEAIERSLLLDGESPYKGMEQLVFQRSFDNTSGEEIPMKGNEEIRPRATEVFERSGVYLSDSKKRSATRMCCICPQGSHTLTLEPVKESMQIFAVELKAAPEIQPYAETGLDEKPRYTGDPLTYQAERIDGGTKAVLKSAQSIRNEVDQSSPIRYRSTRITGGSTSSADPAGATPGRASRGRSRCRRKGCTPSPSAPATSPGCDFLPEAVHRGQTPSRKRRASGSPLRGLQTIRFVRKWHLYLPERRP